MTIEGKEHLCTQIETKAEKLTIMQCTKKGYLTRIFIGDAKHLFGVCVFSRSSIYQASDKLQV
jgi:hypothetical protein